MVGLELFGDQIASRHTDRRTLVRTAGFTSLTLATGAAVPGSVRAQDSATLTIAFNLDPSTLNPMQTTNIAEESVAAAAIEKLALFDATTLDVIPWLAESWTFLDDKTFQIVLKTGITFSNGEVFDAEAAKFSITTWAASPTMAQSASQIEGYAIAVIDATTLRITTPNPVPTLPTLLGRYMYMVPPAYYQEVGEDGFAAAPIGTGPFTFESRRAAQDVTFVRNPNWWRGSHPIEKVIFRVMPEELSRATAIEAGEVDIAYYISDSLADRLKSASGVTVYSIDGLRKFISAFNAEMAGGEPLLDPNVRLALNYAVDVDGLIEYVFSNQATRLEGQYALPGEFGFNPDITAYGYDPDLAKQMLADAGYPDGFSLTYAYTLGRYPKDKEVGEIIATYLQEVGLTVEQKPLEWGEFDTQRKEQTLGHIFQVGLLLTPDLNETFNYMAYGKEVRGGPMLTWSDEWWALYEQSKTTVDANERAGIYHQMLQIEHEEPYGIYLYAPIDFHAASDRVLGFKPRKDQALLLHDLSLATS
ncbi:MAG: ABC transporter substrate-binding protein [Thermomicrobiales bacterium]